MIRLVLFGALILLGACSAIDIHHNSPEYWAEKLSEGPLEEVYPRYREFLQRVPRTEQQSYQQMVEKLRFDAIHARPLDDAGYSSYEEAYIDLIGTINEMEATGRDILGLEEFWSLMKAMLDSPFRFYDGNVVSLVPYSAMDIDQRKQFELVTSAMNFRYAKNLAMEGVPLRLIESDDKRSVVIGGLPIIGYGNVYCSARVELDLSTGMPLRIVHC